MRNLFIKDNIKLSNILVTGVVVVTAGFGGFGISKLLDEKDNDNNKENSNTETTIIETTEKPIETEETIVTTIESIMSEVTTTPMVDEPEEVTTTVANSDAVIYANETVTTVTEAEPVVTTTKVETTVAQTTKAPITTTVATTKAPVVATAQEKAIDTQVKVGMTEQDFDNFTQALINEINSKVTINGKRISNNSKKMFDISDVYTCVYLFNIDVIDDELKQTLMAKYPVIRTLEESLIDSYDIIDPVGTDFESKLALNTQIDELKFAGDYFSGDPNVYWTDNKDADYFANDPQKRSTHIITRLSDIDDDEYFELRRNYYAKNENSDWFKGSKNISVGSLDGFNKFERCDVVDFSVAFYDKNAAKSLQKLIDIMFEASNDNSKNYETLQDIYNFCNHNSNSTSIEHCGVGFEYAANVYIEGFRRYIFDNPYRTGRSSAYDVTEWGKMKRMGAYIQESAADLSNLNRLYNECPYNKEKTKQKTR